MKEKYVKPAIFIERFSLTQNIATDCGAIENGTLGVPRQNSADTCIWDLGEGLNLFTTAVGCAIQLGPNDTFDGVCFNAPNSNNAIFGS